jgi:hypothetical protein
MNMTRILADDIGDRAVSLTRVCRRCDRHDSNEL